VRSQTAPLVTKTNELDDAVAANNRSIQSTNDRAQAGIQQAQQSANTATQNATSATQAANQAQAAPRKRSIALTLGKCGRQSGQLQAGRHRLGDFRLRQE